MQLILILILLIVTFCRFALAHGYTFAVCSLRSFQFPTRFYSYCVCRCCSCTRLFVGLRTVYRVHPFCVTHRTPVAFVYYVSLLPLQLVVVPVRSTRLPVWFTLIGLRYVTRLRLFYVLIDSVFVYPLLRLPLLRVTVYVVCYVCYVLVTHRTVTVLRLHVDSPPVWCGLPVYTLVHRLRVYVYVAFCSCVTLQLRLRLRLQLRLLCTRTVVDTYTALRLFALRAFSPSARVPYRSRALDPVGYTQLILVDRLRFCHQLIAFTFTRSVCYGLQLILPLLIARFAFAVCFG